LKNAGYATGVQNVALSAGLAGFQVDMAMKFFCIDKQSAKLDGFFSDRADTGSSASVGRPVKISRSKAKAITLTDRH